MRGKRGCLLLCAVMERTFTLAVVLAVASTVSAQSQFQLTRNRLFELAHDPELLNIASMFSERVYINYTGQMDTAVVGEATNAVLNCLPWLSLFPGGSVAWYFTEIDALTGEFGSIEETLFDPLRTPAENDVALGANLFVNGTFNQELEIIRTLLAEGAEDPTSGIYKCEVCIERGTPFADCHNSSTEVWGIGAPPDLDSVPSDAGKLRTNM